MLPHAHRQLEIQAADWFKTASSPDDVIFESHQVNLLVDRLLVSKISRESLFSEPHQLLAELMVKEPVFILTDTSIVQDALTHTVWLQDRCQVAAQISSANAVSGPLTIWQQATTPLDLVAA